MRRPKSLYLIGILGLAFCCSPHGQSDPTANLVVTATVTPNPATLGAPLFLRATVTNQGNTPAGFGHDGCPIRYQIDRTFTPPWACAEFWRVITLQPGEQFTFPEPGGAPLVHAPNLYPLGPGVHSFEISVGSAGITAVRVEVFEADSVSAAASGRVVRSDALSGVPRAQVFLHPYGVATENAFIYATSTGEAGYFFFESIPPGAYRLSATVEGVRMWYPGTPDPSQAIVVDLYGYTDNLIIPFTGTPPLGSISGTVFEQGSPQGVSVPLTDAWVTAVRVTDMIVTPESPVRDEPLPQETITAHTDGSGFFSMAAPGGVYKLLAGKFPSHDYAYWDHAGTWYASEVISPFQRNVFTFELKPLPSQSSRTTFAGQVLGFHPFLDGPPEPLADALVEAVPIGPFPYKVLQLARTDANGQYKFEVFPGTPYRLLISKEGYLSQFYGNTPSRYAAPGVDARPGGLVEHLDTILQPAPEPRAASISGRVVARSFDRECGAACISPLAGALVRVRAAYPTFAPYEVTTTTDRNGFFKVSGLASDTEGNLSYYVMAEARGYTEGYYPAGVPFPQAEPLPVFDFQTSDAGIIALSPRGGGGLSLSGVVQDMTGAPIGDAEVLLFPDVTGYDSRDEYGPEYNLSPIKTRTDYRGFFTAGNLAPIPYILGASREGFIPGYYGAGSLVYRWRFAARVMPTDAVSPQEALVIALRKARGAGPYIQAGRVTRADIDSLWMDASAGPRSPREIALSYHRTHIPDAFFYLVSANAVGFGEFVVGGGPTGDNGTVVLTGLPEGVYYAYADRPGFSTEYFTYAGGGVVPIFLSPSTPAVLAEITLLSYYAYEKDPPPLLHDLESKPNPCLLNAGTRIHFTLEMPQNVSIVVYDAQGRRVQEVAQNLFFPGGSQSVPWDGRDQDGSPVTAGVYFYRVVAGKISQSSKIVVVP